MATKRTDKILAYIGRAAEEPDVPALIADFQRTIRLFGFDVSSGGNWVGVRSQRHYRFFFNDWPRRWLDYYNEHGYFDGTSSSPNPGGAWRRSCGARSTRASSRAQSRRNSSRRAGNSAGKTDWAIGELLGISKATAHFHIEQAKRKLGVGSRTQAVALLLLHGVL